MNDDSQLASQPDRQTDRQKDASDASDFISCYMLCYTNGTDRNKVLCFKWRIQGRCQNVLTYKIDAVVFYTTKRVIFSSKCNKMRFVGGLAGSLNRGREMSVCVVISSTSHRMLLYVLLTR